jgi:hypothetical protein
MANPKILIVEDDKVIISIEKCRLLKLGFDVCGSEGCGADAIDCVAKCSPISFSWISPSKERLRV